MRLAAYLRRNHLALIALFVALGGSSYAATQLPKDSVGARQVKRAAIRSAEVKNGARLRKDFKRGQLPRGERGATGQQGARGLQGIQGPAGPERAPWAAVRRPFGVSGFPIDAAAGTITSATLTTPTAGRLLVRFDALEVSQGCSGGGANQFGITVDGVLLVESILGSSSGTPLADPALRGISEELAAGDHTVALRARCTSGMATFTTGYNRPQWTFVLVGEAG